MGASEFLHAFNITSQFAAFLIYVALIYVVVERDSPKFWILIFGPSAFAAAVGVSTQGSLLLGIIEVGSPEYMRVTSFFRRYIIWWRDLLPALGYLLLLVVSEKQRREDLKALGDLKSRGG